jgi:hypothetical protein
MATELLDSTFDLSSASSDSDGSEVGSEVEFLGVLDANIVHVEGGLLRCSALVSCGFAVRADGRTRSHFHCPLVLQRQRCPLAHGSKARVVAHVSAVHDDITVAVREREKGGCTKQQRLERQLERPACLKLSDRLRDCHRHTVTYPIPSLCRALRVHDSTYCKWEVLVLLELQVHSDRLEALGLQCVAQPVAVRGQSLPALPHFIVRPWWSAANGMPSRAIWMM